MQESHAHGYPDMPRTLYETITDFSEGAYVYKFHILSAQPVFIDRSGSLDHYLYAVDISGQPKRFKAAASGQLLVEINDGNPSNNKGRLTFWLIKMKR